MVTAASEKRRILIVDDAPDTLELLRRHLEHAGYRVLTAASVAEGVRVLEDSPVDLVVTDYKMPELSGLDMIRHVRDNYAETGVMMITGYASISGAVQAMSSGAEEYLPKPFTEKELLDAIGHALEKQRIRRTAARTRLEIPSARFGLMGDSDAMCEVHRVIAKAATTTATVLVAGESGTGKELAARAIHYRSPRAERAFVPVNCGGIPESLLEGELFGHVKGAFTGAFESRTGFFQAADGGTIFLDEVSEMSSAMQVKLLRVLQDLEVVMVGAAKGRKVDVRVIAATNKDLFEMVRRKGFREDLFYRLNVITLTMPPLRDRGEDILLLARHFIERYAGEAAKPAPRLSDRAAEVLLEYGWPGNVRELENVMQRIVVLSEGDVIDAPDLPSLMRFSALRNAGIERTLAEVELVHIQRVLESVDGNKSRAARILGIDRKTLREKLARTEKQ
ncbi:MAG: sigma-54-dependent Fis family transcriptional regulator [Planctomycetes bacterium]|nr:sigma-54-dependent Fis family transcriptional regulator [Planctomycetota bacterium]